MGKLAEIKIKRVPELCGSKILRNRMSVFQGFTLAELLIALSILGVIATFTIPKILSAQTNGKYNAIAKEDAAAVAGAFQVVRTNTGGSYSQSSFKLSDLSPYLNYASVDTTTLLDNTETVLGGSNCTDPNLMCLRMHNGSTLFWFKNLETFSTTQIGFFVDPDGTALNTGTTTGPSKSMTFYLSTNGGLQTVPTYTPGWFSW